MSPSCRRISFSRRSRFSSAVTSLSVAAGSTGRRSRLRPIQRTSVDSPIPKSPAISRCVRPLVCARRTASSSNSFVNRRCCVIEFLIAQWELSTFSKQVHYLGRLARRRYAQVGRLLGPGMSEIGMRQRLRLIPEQQYDVAGFRLCLEQLAAQPGTIHRLGVLSALQRVPGAAPTKIPFLRSTTESREREIRTSARCSISAAKRRNVQFVRFATGTDKTSSATASAVSALTGDAPGGLCVRRPATPPCMNVIRHRRTVSSRTPKASPIRLLDQPAKLSKIARARSASPRSCEPANCCNCAWLSAVTITVLRPAIGASTNRTAVENYPPLPLASQPKPA